MFATAKYLGSIKLQARSPFEKLQNQQSFKIDCMIYAQGWNAKVSGMIIQHIFPSYLRPIAEQWLRKRTQVK